MSHAVTTHSEQSILSRILELAEVAHTATPVALYLRPEMLNQILCQEGTTIERLDTHGLTIVVSCTMPSFPGFEIHRKMEGNPSW